MYRRLDAASRELDGLGLTHRSSYLPMLERLANGNPVEPLGTLADVATPATFGQRIRTHRYMQLTPLNQLVDAARPESETARDFGALVDRMDRTQIRIWLTRWRDNDARIEPASQTLNHLGAIGLEALGYLERGERPSEEWLARQRAFFETLRKPQNEIHFAIVPWIEKLVAATVSPQAQP